MVSPAIISTVLSSLWAFKVAAYPYATPLVCEQISVNATLTFATTATSTLDCHSKCEFSGKCDMSKFLPGSVEGPNCFFYDSTKTDATPVKYKPGEKICTRVVCKGKSPPPPVDGCSQFRFVGNDLGDVRGFVANATQCMNLCKANSSCTHALYRNNVGSRNGTCRFIQSDPEGEEVEFFPNESACTKYECGQWETLADYTGYAEGANEEDCARQCVNDCDLFMFDSHFKSCHFLNSTKAIAAAHATYLPGGRMCSTLGKIAPEPLAIEGACPQIKIYGRLLPNTQTNVSSLSDCMDLCNANPECTHSSFHIFVNGTGDCYQFRENYMDDIFDYFAKESLCPRTQGAARHFPRLINDGSVKCGQWPFYGTLLQNITVANELECQKTCRGKCDAYLFDRRPEVKKDNCFLYNSKQWSGEQLLYYSGNQLCSTVFESEEVPQRPGSCPQQRLFGIFIDGGELQTSLFTPTNYQTTPANCLARCNETPGCTHARYNPDKSCSLFQEDRSVGPAINVKVDGVFDEEPGDGERKVPREIQYASGESLCARTIEPLSCSAKKEAPVLIEPESPIKPLVTTNVVA